MLYHESIVAHAHPWKSFEFEKSRTVNTDMKQIGAVTRLIKKPVHDTQLGHDFVARDQCFLQPVAVKIFNNGKSSNRMIIGILTDHFENAAPDCCYTPKAMSRFRQHDLELREFDHQPSLSGSM